MLLLMSFLLTVGSVKSQDKIITIKNDTIDCLIISVGREQIIYEQSYDNNIIGNSIATSDVLRYLRSAHSEKQSGNFRTKPAHEKPVHRLLFTLRGGLAYSLTDFTNYKNMMMGSGVPAPEIDDYIGKLKNGYHIDSDFHYLLNNFLGIGAGYTLFFSAAEANHYMIGYNEMNIPLVVKIDQDEKYYTHFAGPSILFQQFPGRNRKVMITEIISPGIVMFRGESRGNQYRRYWQHDLIEVPLQYYDKANTVSRSKTFGVKGGLSLRYCFTPQFSAGLTGSFIWGKLNKLSSKGIYELKDQELEESINVSHFNYGFTVSYNF